MRKALTPIQQAHADARQGYMEKLAASKDKGLYISPYLQNYLDAADKLPERLPDIPEVVVRALQARIRTLVQYVAARDEEIRQLEQKLVAKQAESLVTAQVELPRDEDR